MARNLIMAAAVAMTGTALTRLVAQCAPPDGADVAGADDTSRLPPGVTPYRAAFKNWPGEIVVDSLWTCSVAAP